MARSKNFIAAMINETKLLQCLVMYIDDGIWALSYPHSSTVGALTTEELMELLEFSLYRRMFVGRSLESYKHIQRLLQGSNDYVEGLPMNGGLSIDE